LVETQQVHEGKESQIAEYSLSRWNQFVVNFKRLAVGEYRSPKMFRLSVLRALVLGLIFGTVFWMRPKDQKGATERVSVLFFSAVYAFLSAFAAIPSIFATRLLFHRERAEKMYQTVSFVSAIILTDLPFTTFGVFLFTIPFYWLSGLKREPGAYFFFLLVVIGVTLSLGAFARALAALLASPGNAGVAFATVVGASAVAAGFLRPKSLIPNFMIWAYWISPFRYSLQALANNEFTGLHFNCNDIGGGINIGNSTFCPITTGEQFLRSFDMKTNLRWLDVGVLFMYYLAFGTIMAFAMRFINHIKR